MRPHEYSNQQRDTLSVFRIDFGATVLKDDGSEQLILIELQKTWLETETLRFRQYLGAQYGNPKNIAVESKEGYALPMVAVYLLGHRVGQIAEPVLYVSHQGRDYQGNVVTTGLPDPFVESLTHDSIIVQIPLLSGRVNSRLYQVLSIFDQTRKDSESGQVLCLEDGAYAGDGDMEYIVRRLQAAAADAEVRREMTVEDEFFSAIEKRDTTILQKDREIAEKNVELEQKNVELEQKNVELEQKNVELHQQYAQLEQKEASLRKSIQMLLRANLTPEAIAESLGMSVGEVRALM